MQVMNLNGIATRRRGWRRKNERRGGRGRAGASTAATATAGAATTKDAASCQTTLLADAIDVRLVVLMVGRIDNEIVHYFGLGTHHELVQRWLLINGCRRRSSIARVGIGRALQQRSIIDIIGDRWRRWCCDFLFGGDDFEMMMMIDRRRRVGRVLEFGAADQQRRRRRRG